MQELTTRANSFTLAESSPIYTSKIYIVHITVDRSKNEQETWASPPKEQTV